MSDGVHKPVSPKPTHTHAPNPRSSSKNQAGSVTGRNQHDAFGRDRSCLVIYCLSNTEGVKYSPCSYRVLHILLLRYVGGRIKNTDVYTARKGNVSGSCEAKRDLLGKHLLPVDRDR